MKLGIFDQSPVVGERSGREAIERTISMAKYAEELGYYRFWVAEQHASTAFASATPEIVASSILSQTQDIRVGVAGILVGHYAPLKVAETVNALNVIGRGRFDFGIGRTPGATPDVIDALGGFEFMPDNINDKIDEVFAYLDNEVDISAVPGGEQINERWLLCGSVGGAARYAARKGMPLAYAHFVNPAQCLDAIALYRREFQPSHYLDKPYVSIALNAIVADSDEQAKNLAKPALSYFVLNHTSSQEHGFLSQVQADAIEFDEQQSIMAQQVLEASFIGSQATVKDKLQSLISAAQCDELALLTIVDDPGRQRYTYEQVAAMLEELK